MALAISPRVVGTPRASRGMSERVVLLHGLGRTTFDFLLLSRDLKRAGYLPVPLPYPSNYLPLHELESILATQIGSPPTAIVGHSLGGILAARLACHFDQNPLAITIGSPVVSSEVARLVSRVPGANRFFGPVLSQLAEGGLVPQIPSRLHHIVATIPGGSFINPFIKAPHDGLVGYHEQFFSNAPRTELIGLHGVLPFQPSVRRAVLDILGS